MMISNVPRAPGPTADFVIGGRTRSFQRWNASKEADERTGSATCGRLPQLRRPAVFLHVAPRRWRAVTFRDWSFDIP